MTNARLGKSSGRKARLRPARQPKRRAPKRAAVKKRTSGPQKMKAYASFDLYLADRSPLHRQLIGVLRKMVRRVAPSLQESVKWGNGCWLLGKVPVAYVYAAPDHLHFGFVRGAALPDPRGLLEGDGQYVRHTKLRRRADIDEQALTALLRAAIASSPSVWPPR